MMYKYTLKFQDQHLENKFQTTINQKLSIQCKFIAILIIVEESLVSINALLQQQYIASIFLISFILIYFAIYQMLVRYPNKIKYGIYWFNVSSFLLPIALQIYIWFIDVELVDKISVTIGIMNVIPQFILTQDIFISSGLYLYTMVIIVISCIQLFGFSLFLCIPPLFTISWIISKFQSIKLERIFFSESQTNECLATVLRRICKEKIMIFTYDDPNIKYQEYLLNDECKKYFHDCTLNEILSNIFVIYENKQISISSYIHRNLIQNHNQEEFQSEAFQGYFKDKKNQFLIDLFVHTTSKTFFTIKITEIQKQVNFSKIKAKQLLQMQNKVLQKILPKYIEIFQKDLSLTKKIEQFYQFLNQQISILRLHIVCNSKDIQFFIKKFDLIHQINEQFNKANKRFILQLCKNKEMDPQYQQFEQIQQVFINSDQFLIAMFMENILMLIRVTIDKDSLVRIQVVYERDFIHLEFRYKALNQPQLSGKNHQKLVKSLSKLTEFIGIKESLIIQKSHIQLKLINFLEISYQ